MSDLIEPVSWLISVDLSSNKLFFLTTTNSTEFKNERSVSRCNLSVVLLTRFDRDAVTFEKLDTEKFGGERLTLG